MYNGLNEDTTGACSGEGLEIVRSFSGSDKAVRMQYELEGIRKRMQEPLRDFYWQDGRNYIWFTTISQGLWLFALLGILTEAALLLEASLEGIRKRKASVAKEQSDFLCVSVAMIVTFIGMFLFVMLFEARARYLYNMVPIFSVMAVLGYCKLYQKFCIFFDKKRG